MLLLGLQPRPSATTSSTQLNDSFSAIKLCFFSNILFGALEKRIFDINKRKNHLYFVSFPSHQATFSMIEIHICKHDIYINDICTYWSLGRVEIWRLTFIDELDDRLLDLMERKREPRNEVFSCWMKIEEW